MLGPGGVPIDGTVSSSLQSKEAVFILVCEDTGYGKASLAQIGKRAQVTPSLVLYHFADKDDLIAQTLETIATAWDADIEQQVRAAATPVTQLQAYITASLAYLGTRPTHFAAMIEIAFNARSPDGALLYRSDAEEPGLVLLRDLLAQGQAEGVFRPFDTHAMAVAIRGAINEFFGEMHKPGRSLERYSAELVALFTRATAP